MAKRGYTREEARRRRTTFKVLSGFADFFGTVAGFVLVLVCIVVIASLLTWFSSDITKVFSTLIDPLMQALEGAT